MLRYSGLHAFDSTGRALPAQFELDGRTLLLRVDDRGARYPVTVDPLVQVGSQADAYLALRQRRLRLERGSLRRRQDCPGRRTPRKRRRRGGLDLHAHGCGRGLGLDGRGDARPGHRRGDRRRALRVQRRARRGRQDRPGRRPGRRLRMGAAWSFAFDNSETFRWYEQGELTTPSDVIGTTPRIGSSVALSGDAGVALIGGPGDNDGMGAAWVFDEGRRGAEAAPGHRRGDRRRRFAPASRSMAAAQGGADRRPARQRRRRCGVGLATNIDSWGEATSFRPSNEVGAGLFGTSVALSDDGLTALMGAPGNDTNLGAAWVFTESDVTQLLVRGRTVASGTTRRTKSGPASSATAWRSRPTRRRLSSARPSTTVVSARPGSSKTCSSWTTSTPVGCRRAPSTHPAAVRAAATSAGVRRSLHGGAAR